MKKLFILGAACLFAQGVLAQQSIKFSVRYLPKHSYATTVKTDMDMIMNMGDEATMKALKEAGQPSSMLMKLNMNMGADIATQAEDAKKDVPLVMTFTDITMAANMNGQAIPIPATEIKDIKFSGRYSNQTKKISIEGVQGGTIDETKKAAAETQLAQMFNQYNFPDTTLKIGDTFVQDMPLSLPIGNSSADVMTKVKYTLKEIKGNTALFDLSQDMDMKVNVQQIGGDMVMKGTGNGTMVYDITEKFPVQYDMTMDLSFNMNAGGAPISGSMKGISAIGVKVTKK